jgi:hypothetical protein
MLLLSFEATYMLLTLLLAVQAVVVLILDGVWAAWGIFFDK